MVNKSGYGLFVCLGGLVAIAGLGCQVSSGGGGGGAGSSTLLSVSSVSIPAGSDALALGFEAEEGREVVVTVTADTDRADPDLQVVIGDVNLDELDDVPIGDLVLVSTDRDSPQESGSFTPDADGPFTLFITEASDFDFLDISYSVTVTQRD